MPKVNETFSLGEKIQMNFPKGGKSIFIVEAYTEDEIALCGPDTMYSSLTRIPVKEVVFAKTTTFDGKKVSQGDKVKLINKEGKTIEVYISYILNKDSIIVSKKKTPALSALRWLLKLMSGL
ncbi:MAG: hypothetical protein AB7I27_19205 [Bacteriovoracaceae bacterium]